MQIITMTKENIKLTNTQIEVFIKATSKYLDAIQNADNLIELFGSMDFVYPDQSTFSRPFYKFIHKETYDNFMSKENFNWALCSIIVRLKNKKVVMKRKVLQTLS